MDIVINYAEFLAALVLLLFSFSIIFVGIIDPTLESIQTNYEARADKAATYTNSLNLGLGVHDQKVGRTPGVDPIVGYDEKDSGLSRMYFRPEQFVMIPAVDTDIASNPNVSLERRIIAISTDYTKVGTGVNPMESRGLTIGADAFVNNLQYVISRDSLYNKQITYESIMTEGLYGAVKSKAVYPNINYGTQVDKNNPLKYGGFNITLDSSIHPVSKKESNSIIFVSGRVPSK